MDVDAFYNASRLHFIGDWKYTAKRIITEVAQEMYLGRGIGATNMQIPSETRIPFRSILRKTYIVHVDMDCFFASMAMRGRPDLQVVPIAVCHAGKYSEIASCNYVSRQRGVRNGMILSTAKKVCPEIRVVPYDFDTYTRTMKQVYSLAFELLSDIHRDVPLSSDLTVEGPPTSIETALEVLAIDDFLLGFRFRCETEEYLGYEENTWENSIQQIVVKTIEELRLRIFQQTECTASAGISQNSLLARVLTDLAKPNGQKAFFGDTADRELLLGHFDISSFAGIGRVLTEKIEVKLGTTKCRDLQSFTEAFLETQLGSALGKRLFKVCRGHCDREIISTLSDETSRKNESCKTLSCCMNYGIRPKSLEDIHQILKKLARNVCEKMTTCSYIASNCHLVVKYRHPDAPLETFKHGAHGWCKEAAVVQKLSPRINDQNTIYTALKALFEQTGLPLEDVRGLSVKVKAHSTVSAKKELKAAPCGTLTQIYKRKKSEPVDPIPVLKEDPILVSIENTDCKQNTFFDIQPLQIPPPPLFEFSDSTPCQDPEWVRAQLSRLSEALLDRKYLTVKNLLLLMKDTLPSGTYEMIRESAMQWMSENAGCVLRL